ncbi:hypothetical protein [Roseomonas rosulenta]|uniref:hypothetical protein n=1 Tax=Roseomonas rosulenta TaxID=2748667 RepID=UPI0018DF2C79|nr:hypothetical protein [Roseomonas rosulenta]
MRLAASLLLLAGLAWPAPAPANGAPASPVLPVDGPPPPLVVLLPDATGDQARSEPYIEALARRGIATLVLGIEDQGEGDRASTAPRPGQAAIDLVRAWADGDSVRLDGQRIAVIGFGAGARVALTVEDAPVVALDPGCRGLDLPPAPRRALLVHGLASADAALCVALADRAGLAHLPLPGIGHGWDLPVVLAPGGALLPDPSGPGRRRARPDPIATAAVAEAVAEWIAARLRQVGP